VATPEETSSLRLLVMRKGGGSLLLGSSVIALAAALMTAAVSHFRGEVGLLDTGLIFLALTLVQAWLWGRWLAFFAAGVDYFCLNFFFIPPLHRIVVQDPKNLGAWVLEVGLFVGVAFLGSRPGRLVSGR
jgi:two-component system sensor histidine kinase KdpD